jgi:hypothetical protein
MFRIRVQKIVELNDGAVVPTRSPSCAKSLVVRAASVALLLAMAMFPDFLRLLVHRRDIRGRVSRSQGRVSRSQGIVQLRIVAQMYKSYQSAPPIIGE